MVGPLFGGRVDRDILDIIDMTSDCCLSSHFVFVFPATTPWFEAYRENFLQSMPASDHEFLNHYLACILPPARKIGHTGHHALVRAFFKDSS